MSNIFLDVATIIGDNDNLDYINYESISEEHKEFLRSDMWDLEFLQAPAACYFPGNELLKKRTKGTTPSFPTELGEISADIRHFTIRQKTISGTTKGTISVDYVDREDQAIRFFLDDWRDKIWNRQNRYAFRKEDTIATLKLTQFNSSRVPIIEYVMYAVQPDAIGDPFNSAFTSDDPANTGEFSVTFSFEHYDVNPLNI